MSAHEAFPEPADAIEARLRLQRLRERVTRIRIDLFGLAGEDRTRANAEKQQAEREISFLRWWIRRDAFVAHQQRKAIRALAPDTLAALHAIYASADAMGGEGLVYITPEQYEALRGLLESQQL